MDCWTALFLPLFLKYFILSKNPNVTFFTSRATCPNCVLKKVLILSGCQERSMLLICNIVTIQVPGHEHHGEGVFRAHGRQFGRENQGVFLEIAV